MNERKPRQRHKTIIHQLTEEEQAMLSAQRDLSEAQTRHTHPSAFGPVVVLPKPDQSYPEPVAFHAGPGASITIDGLGCLTSHGGPFLSDMDQLTAAKLIKAIAKHTGLHPDAISDFMDDLTEGMEP